MPVLHTSAGAAVSPIVPLHRRRVAVVGAGFLGMRIAAQAVDRGLHTSVLARRPVVDSRLVSARARILVGDAADPRAIDRLLSRPAHVVYCAGGRLPTDSIDDPGGDAVGTLAPLLCLLEALRRHPGSRLTLLSSGGTVYGRPEAEPVDEDHACRPLVPYGVSRLSAEHYARLYGELHAVPVRILRLANVYGPSQPSNRPQGVVATLLAAAGTGEPVQIWGTGRVARDFIHVDDVADVVFRLPESGGPEVLNVGTGIASTLWEVVETVERVTGRTLRLSMQPPRAFDIERIALSSQRLSALIPFSPMDLEHGLSATWAASRFAAAADDAAARSL